MTNQKLIDIIYNSAYEKKTVYGETPCMFCQIYCLSNPGERAVAPKQQTDKEISMSMSK